MARNTSPSTVTMDFEDKLEVAYMYYIRGISQQDLAALKRVNSGRISEACTTVKAALAPEGRHQ